MEAGVTLIESSVTLRRTLLSALLAKISPLSSPEPSMRQTLQFGRQFDAVA